MKRNCTLLLLAMVTALFVGCKPKNADIDDALKQISEETFAKTPTRSYFACQDDDMFIVEYTFDVNAKKAVRKSVNLLQKAAYTGLQEEKFSYTWGDFQKDMFGRQIILTGAAGDETLTYLNDQLTANGITTSIAEPRADMAANMIDGLTAGKWEAVDPTYVLQLHWVDTIVYEYHVKGKKIVCDTIHKNMPRPNFYDTIGIDSCYYYTFTFENGATNKLASRNTDFQKNIVTADSTIQPQLQDPSKNDTIIKYTVQEGVRVFDHKTDFITWTIKDISLKNEEQNVDVVVGEVNYIWHTLAMTNFRYDGAKGSFLMDENTYIFIPKN